MTPSGVVMASSTQLTMECVTWMNSMENGPSVELAAGLHFVELRGIEHLVLFEAALDQGQREGGAVDRDVHLRQQERDAADVVFVAVGENQAADVLAILLEVGEVGRDDVDAQQFGVGEHHAGVEDDDVVAVADGHAVHAELAQAPERDDL